MKYSVLLAFLSLAAWKYGYLPAAGISGLLAGWIYILSFRQKINLIAIGCISAGIISVMLFPMEFSLTACFYIGLSWSITITALFVCLILLSLILKTKEKFLS